MTITRTVEPLKLIGASVVSRLDDMNRFLLIVAVCALAGCMRAARHGLEIQQNNLRQRASFDLNCSADQIELFALGTAQVRGYHSSYGVRGCDEQAVYVQLERLWTAAWIMNSRNGQSVSAPGGTLPGQAP